ncbi:MAG TPA: hypothetical protein VFE02_03025 [Candidatus Acidoferrales bacterium]|nr:hypothetical protein [Candidatus Acidoferrales bacterium]
MKTVSVTLSIFLLLAPFTVPARADFKYTETSKITGGALKSAMKFAGVFSKQASQATKPVVTTHYVKGKRLRTDNSDGQIQIIDLEGRRIIDIDPVKHTYSEITFDQMKQAMENAQQKMQQQMDQNSPAQDPKAKDVKANMDVKFKVTPGTSSREIMGQSTNETKVEIEMNLQAQDTSKTSQPNDQVNGSVLTTMDMWVAPSVPGYEELGRFYAQMAKEINWVPPSNIHVDPRASQSLDELQKNSANLKGFPLLQYMVMSMVAKDAQGNVVQPSSPPPSSSSSSSSSSDSTPTSMSGAMAKGIGGLFNKKKKQDDAADQNSQNPPPPSTPGSLIEMTIEVSSYSDSSLDANLFDIPSGFTRIVQNADQLLSTKPQ